MRVLGLTFLAVLLWLSAIAQQIPNKGLLGFVQNYTVEDYKAARQNFDITQDRRGLMYFANTDEAVLVFDGSQWERIRVPNNSVFSVFSFDDKIFVGAKNDFGVLERTPDYGLQYKSLYKALVKQPIHGFGNVWQITVTPDTTVIFLAPYALFFYKNGRIKTFYIDSLARNSLFLRMFNVNGEVYFVLKYKGLYRLVGDTIEFIPNTQELWDVMAMLPYENGKILYYSYFKGFYVFDGKDKFTYLKTELNDFLVKDIYKAIALKQDYYAFALVSGGVLIVDRQLRPVQKIDLRSGLYNDKVWNLYLDDQDNLWLALDNGIASVRIFSPFTFFNHNYGFQKSTKVLGALLWHDTLYIANSYGLAWRPWEKYEDKLSPIIPFEPVEGLDQKTFVLRLIDNKVFGSDDFGLYYLKGLKPNYVSRERAVRFFINLRSRPDIIIGAKDALQLFIKQNGQWRFKGYIKGFKGPLRYIAEDDSGFIWGSEKTVGVYKIYLNKAYDSVEKIVYYNSQDGLHGLPSQYKNFVFRVGQKIIFATVDGFYAYNYQADSFEPMDSLNRLLGDNREINLIYADSEGNLWIRRLVKHGDDKNWELDLIKSTGKGYRLESRLFYPFKNRIFSITQLDSVYYLIGSEGGFILYNSRIQIDTQLHFRTYIRLVKLLAADSVIYRGFSEPPEAKTIILPYKYNDLRFVFSAGYYADPKHIKYSYYLSGYDEGWSDWRAENVKEYSNLPAGNYVFQVRAINPYGQISTIARFAFTIRPPWYLTVWAIILYLILAVLLVWLIVYLYTLRLRKQKEYLEEQVRLRTLEIEKQKREIEAQRDLLAKKNEEIQRKNKDITSSIEYAKRIQTAMLPLEETISKYLPEHFILFRPRDIVSGDFYWFAYKNGKIIIAAVDCTGHGVPGAFMSMIGAEILNTIVLTNGITDPAQILNMQHQYIRTALKQDTTDNQDGMDMALCVIDKQAGILEFAGAKNSLVYIDKHHKLHRIRGDRQSIGGYQFAKHKGFTKHTVKIDSPMWFYIFSDGYQDQFGGGDPPTKFLMKNFYQLLWEIHTLPMSEQKRILEERLDLWKNGYSQTDDILVIGFKL